MTLLEQFREHFSDTVVGEGFIDIIEQNVVAGIVSDFG
jgi:hypothetical protein